MNRAVLISLLLLVVFIVGCSGINELTQNKDENLAEAQLLASERNIDVNTAYNIVGMGYRSTLPRIVYLNCTDSDNGINYNTAGYTTVTYTYGDGPKTSVYNDTCSGKVLKEYYCVRHKSNAVRAHTCTYACSEGRCISAPAPSCTDNDKDGYGTASSTGCTHNGVDCDDSNANVNPGAGELCNNVDDNCNGQIDEGLSKTETCGAGACANTVSQACYSGTWSPVCEPKDQTAEACNNIDDDCNGQIDEGISSQTQACTVANGAGSQSRSCSAGAWSDWGTCTIVSCNSGYQMSGNACVANSCTGSSTQSCSITNGAGSQNRSCSAGAWSDWGTCTVVSCNTGYQISGNACAAATCTGSSTQSCAITNGVGSQSRTCTAGVWSGWGTCTVVSCNTGYQISGNACVAASCTGSASQSCSAGVGACLRSGTQTRSCTAGVWSGWSSCSATAGSPTTEICGNGIDEDCNGADLSCAPSSNGIKYYGVDTRDGSRSGYSNVYSQGGFSLMKNHSFKTIVMDISISASHTTYQNYIKYATDNDMYIVIWPNQGGDYPNCGWEDPFQPNASGDYIRRVTNMLDELAGSSRIIGIVSAHEPAWNNAACADSIDDMAAIRTQLKNYVYNKFGRRDFLVWNYFDNVADVSAIPGYKSPNDIARIADVGVTWEHCFGNNEGTCPQARQKIISDANMIHNNGLDANVSLVFLFQTFSQGSSYWMPNATQLHDYACDWSNLKRADGKNALDGFMWYTWGACWYKADLFCPQQNPYIDYSTLWPAVDTVGSACINGNTGDCTGSSTQSCAITNGVGSQSRTCTAGVWSGWGTCTVVSCNTGYQISGNACVAASCTGSASQSCSAGVGACARTGTQTRSCTSGVWSGWSSCSVTAGSPTTEICGNGIDEDCNGADLACAPNGQTFSFVIFTDTHAGWSTLTPLMTKAKAMNPAFALFTGDTMDDGVDSSTLNTWKSYVGVMYNITFPVRGNHDDHFTGALTNFENYYDISQVANRVGATNFHNYANMPNAVYSFDYGNSHFVGLDVPGDIGYITSDQVVWLDSDLTAAEGRGITNAFIFDHGAIYSMGGSHNDCGTTRLCNKYDYYGLVTMLNKHPIFAAGFHGHEHLYGYALIDSSRIASVTSHPFYEIVDGNAGGDNRLCDANRCDYSYSGHGFTYVTVNGNQMTVKWYDGGTTVTNTLTFTNT